MDELRAAQRKYDEAESGYHDQMAKLSSLKSSKSQAEHQLSGINSQVINLEQRLATICLVLNLFQNSVENCIDSAKSASKAADTSYSSSLICKEITPKSIFGSFDIQNVDGNEHSSSAHSACKLEKRRLEEGIAQLKQQIRSLESQIAAFGSSIQSCQSLAAGYRASMNRAAAAMESVHRP